MIHYAVILYRVPSSTPLLPLCWASYLQPLQAAADVLRETLCGNHLDIGLQQLPDHILLHLDKQERTRGDGGVRGKVRRSGGQGVTCESLGRSWVMRPTLVHL